ncbi:RidA family protein [Flectobacillus major]|uniref:RidA family protein n=1 Tax=Flectobacillus major TaxID=103 RepID=UPI00047E28D5|nr:RidA family protein [Flectobacillus major]
MKKITFLGMFLVAFCSQLVYSQQLETNAPNGLTFYGTASSPISSGAVVPAGKKYFWSSGITCGVADSTAKEGTYQRYGNTKVQAESILKNLLSTLKKQGLSFKDVLFMRVYLAPDKFMGKTDYQGWFDAYGQYFGTKENPIKPCRSTLGIAGLVTAEKFVEIEIVAVYP